MPARVISDEEVLGIMADGGRKLCDYAIEQWWSGKYAMDATITLEMVAEWKEKQGRISGLTKRLKAYLREQGEESCARPHGRRDVRTTPGEGAQSQRPT